MTCSDCATAAQVEHHGFAANCPGCAARSIARIFLRRGERGRRMRMACEQFGLLPADVHAAWKVDAMNPERST